VQTNHAESLNCLAYDLLKNALRNLIHEAVKNKTLFEPRYCWKFSTKVSGEFVLFQRNGANS